MRANSILIQNPQRDYNYCLLLLSSNTSTGSISIGKHHYRSFICKTSENWSTQEAGTKPHTWNSWIPNFSEDSPYRLAFTLLCFQDTVFFQFLWRLMWETTEPLSLLVRKSSLSGKLFKGLSQSALPLLVLNLYSQNFKSSKLTSKNSS